MSFWFRDPLFGFDDFPIDPFAPFFGHAFNRQRYMDQIDNAINSALRQALLDQRQESTENTEQEKPSKSTGKPKKGAEKKQEKKEGKKEEKNEEEESDIFSKMSVFSSHSRGGIEEVHETITDSNGISNEVHTKKIGDRWVRIEKKTDKDGTVTKETWHNVDSNDRQKFEDEWNQRRRCIGLSTDDKKAIEDKSA